MSSPTFYDFYNLEEDKRIDLIGHRVLDHQEIVALLLEDDTLDEGKITRYLQKLQKKFPTIRILDQKPYRQVPHIMVVRLAPPEVTT